MKIALFVGLLGLTACADNDIQGPGNFVHHGKHNSIKGKNNHVDGFHNNLVGNENKVDGDKNSVEGNNNFVLGDGNLILGSENVVFDDKDIGIELDIEEDPSVKQAKSSFFNLNEEVKQPKKSLEEEIR
jgi:hypothetical protein